MTKKPTQRVSQLQSNSRPKRNRTAVDYAALDKEIVESRREDGISNESDEEEKVHTDDEEDFDADNSPEDNKDDEDEESDNDNNDADDENTQVDNSKQKRLAKKTASATKQRPKKASKSAPKAKPSNTLPALSRKKIPKHVSEDLVAAFIHHKRNWELFFQDPQVKKIMKELSKSQDNIKGHIKNVGRSKNKKQTTGRGNEKRIRW